MNDQSKNISKCDFDIFFIFNGLSAIENGGTSMCRGTSEFFRGSLDAHFLINKKALLAPFY
jgi:hypothetical protein